MNVNTVGSIDIDPIKLVSGQIDLPGSKSISNRVLLLASQAKGTTRLINLLQSDDVNRMLSALKNFGIVIRILKDKQVCEVDGIGGTLFTYERGKSLFLGNSGTSMRFLTAALALKNSDIVLTGDSRMKERPIKHLVNALLKGGAKINYLEKDGYPPLKVSGGYLGGDIVIKGDISSQFLSGILMMAPLSSCDTYIYVDGNVVSKPYIDITLSIMRDFGICIKNESYHTFYCRGRSTYCSPGNYLIEGDASSASYFLAAGAIRGGTVRVNGVGKNSIQGDIRCADVLEKMGSVIHWGDNYISCTRNVLNPIDIDMNDIPDITMTIAVTALFSGSKFPTILRNIYNLRLKESDRLMAISIELRKTGAIVVEGNDYLEILAPDKIRYSKINTYNDHRMAMAFSLIALSDTSVTILDPSCVNKTFPSFFSDFFRISVFK